MPLTPPHVHTYQPRRLVVPSLPGAPAAVQDFLERAPQKSSGETCMTLVIFLPRRHLWFLAMRCIPDASCYKSCCIFKAVLSDIHSHWAGRPKVPPLQPLTWPWGGWMDLVLLANPDRSFGEVAPTRPGLRCGQCGGLPWDAWATAFPGRVIGGLPLPSHYFLNWEGQGETGEIILNKVF